MSSAKMAWVKAGYSIHFIGTVSWFNL